MYKKYVKRLLDIIFSAILIILLFPIEVITGLICLICNKSIFFTQTRIGKNKIPFTIYKFKSLNDKPGTNYERSNTVTRFLRTAGLDELPQLLNILKGEMSFIGPRPFIKDEELPTKPNDIIYSVLPGLTGMAQSHGRRNISHEKRLEYDEYYVKNVKFTLDIEILIKTILTLFN